MFVWQPGYVPSHLIVLDKQEKDLTLLCCWLNCGLNTNYRFGHFYNCWQTQHAEVFTLLPWQTGWHNILCLILQKVTLHSLPGTACIALNTGNRTITRILNYQQPNSNQDTVKSAIVLYGCFTNYILSIKRQKAASELSAMREVDLPLQLLIFIK